MERFLEIANTSCPEFFLGMVNGPTLTDRVRLAHWRTSEQVLNAIQGLARLPDKSSIGLVVIDSAAALVRLGFTEEAAGEGGGALEKKSWEELKQNRSNLLEMLKLLKLPPFWPKW